MALSDQTTMFAEPQWPLRMADAAKDFGYAGNTITVRKMGREPKTWYFEVPTAFFLMAERALRQIDFELARFHGIQFYLEEERGTWYFGFIANEPHNYLWRHLWHYTDATVPGWLV